MGITLPSSKFLPEMRHCAQVTDCCFRELLKILPPEDVGQHMRIKVKRPYFLLLSKKFSADSFISFCFPLSTCSFFSAEAKLSMMGPIWMGSIGQFFLESGHTTGEGREQLDDVGRTNPKL